ncbi:MAG: hypothetical protein ACLURY_00075 [Alistipes putredinis]
MRKLFKYTLRIILVLFTLVVLVMILLYIPAIQNFVKGKAEQYVNRNLDMKLSVGRILLKFPLDLAVENIYLGQTEKDTLLYADVIQVNVALTELLKKEIEVRRLVVENAAVHFRGFSFRIENESGFGGTESSGGSIESVATRGRDSFHCFKRRKDSDEFGRWGVCG